MPEIIVTELTKRYGRTLALDRVSLEVREGELFALLGPNGAGKTSLLHILSTILSPDSGTASVSGFDVARRPLKARQQIGVVFQEPSLDDRLTVYENLNFHGLVYGVRWRSRRRRIIEMLDLVELSDWQDHLVRSLSAGMKRRLEIARALLHNPRILFLDEPTVGLDVQSRQNIWRYLEQLQTQKRLTIVVSSHYIDEVEVCDRLCIVDHGQILAEDTPDALKSRHGEDMIRIVASDAATREAVQAAFPESGHAPGGALLIPAGQTTTGALFERFGAHLEEIAFVRPSLESVFLRLTGRAVRDRAAGDRERTYAFGKRGGELTR